MFEKRHRPRSSALRRGRVSVGGYAYFITKCTLDIQTTVLAQQECANIIIESLIWLKERRVIHLCGFVIMPNHYHCVIGVLEKKSLSEILESVSKYTARRINGIFDRKGQFWQDGFYDHFIRDRCDFDDILQYMHYNPVKAGLVPEPGLWPYSTAHPKYAHLIDWDWLGPNLHP